MKQCREDSEACFVGDLRLVKAPGLLLGFLSRNRFYRWGVFINRFLKAHIKRMMY
jgi:hypothetical protein